MASSVEDVKIRCLTCGAIASVPYHQWTCPCANRECRSEGLLAPVAPGMKYVWVKGQKHSVDRVQDRQLYVTCDCCRTDHYIESVVVKQINGEDVYGSYPARDFVRKQSEELYILRRALDTPQEECARVLAEEELAHAKTKDELALMNDTLEERTRAVLRANEKSSNLEKENQRLQAIIDEMAALPNVHKMRQVSEAAREAETKILEKRRQDQEEAKERERMLERQRQEIEWMKNEMARLEEVIKRQSDDLKKKLMKNGASDVSRLKVAHLDLISENQKHTSAMNRNAQRLREVTEERDKAREDLEQANKKFRQLEEDGNKSMVMLEEKVKQIKEKQEKAIAAEGYQQRLINEHYVEIYKLQTELRKFKDENNKLTTLLETKQTEQKGLEEEVAQTKAQLEKGEHEFQNSLNGLKEQLEKAAAADKDTIRVQEKLLGDCSETISSQEKLLLEHSKTAEALVDKAKAVLEKEHQDALRELQEQHQTEVAALKSDQALCVLDHISYVNDYISNISQLEAEKKKLEEAVAHEKQGIASLKRTLSERASIVAKVQLELQFMKGQQSDLEQEMRQLKISLEAKDQEHQDLSKKLQEQQETITSKTEAFEAQEKVLSERSAALDKTKNDFDQLQEQQKVVEAEASQSKALLDTKDKEHKDLSKKLREQQETMASKAEAFEAQEKVLSERCAALDKAKKDLEQLQEQQKVVEKVASQSKALFETKDKEHQDLSKKLQEQQETMASMAEAFEAQKKVLKDQKSKLEEELLQMKTRLETQDQEHRDSLKELQKQTEIITNKTEAFEAQEKVLSERCAALDKAKKDVEQLQEQQQVVEAEASQSNALLEATKQNYQDALKELQELRKDMKTFVTVKQEPIDPDDIQHLEPSADIANMERELDYLQEQKREMDVVRMRFLLETKAKECHDYLTKLQEQQETIIAQTEALDSLEKLLSERADDLVKVDEELEQLREKNVSLEKGAIETKTLLEAKEKEHQESLKELIELQENAIAAQKENVDARDNGLMEPSFAMAKMKKVVDQLLEQKALLEDGAVFMRFRLEAKEKEHQDALKELKELREKAIDEAVANAAEQKIIAEHTATLVELKDHLKDQKKQLEKDVIEMESLLEAKRKECQDYLTKLHEQQEIITAKTEAFEAQEKVLLNRSEELAKINAELAQLKEQKKGLEDEVGKAHALLDSAEQDYQDTLKKLQEQEKLLSPETNNNAPKNSPTIQGKKRRNEEALDETKPFKKRREEKEIKPSIPWHKPSLGSSLASTTPLKPPRTSSLDGNCGGSVMQDHWKDILMFSQLVDPTLGKQEEPDDGYGQSGQNDEGSETGGGSARLKKEN